MKRIDRLKLSYFPLLPNSQVVVPAGSWSMFDLTEFYVGCPPFPDTTPEEFVPPPGKEKSNDSINLRGKKRWMLTAGQAVIPTASI